MADFLRVDQVEEDIFETTIPGSGYLFGGCTLFAAVLAAGKCVAGLSPKSLQAHFLRAGEWGRRTTLRVTRWPDTRTFASRSATVCQGERVLATVSASFHRPEPGPSWQKEPMRSVPSPDALAPSPVRLPVTPMEVRAVGRHESPAESWHPYWARAVGRLGEEPIVNHAALSFMSDYVVIFSLHDAASAVAPTENIRTISHALWFHRPVVAERWHLFDSQPQSVSDRRGLTLGTISSEDGSLVASFAQEVIIRP